jgi:hypothetical protein
MLQRMFRLCGIETSRRLYKKAVYMLMHLAMGVVTCGLATLFWHSRVAHSAFLLAICGASVWNAAGFYFTVFAQRCARPRGRAALLGTEGRGESALWGCSQRLIHICVEVRLAARPCAA